MRGWWPVLIVAAGAVLLAILATTPPAQLPASAPASAFSARRAMADVAVIGARPHPTGSTADAAVRAYLVQRLRGMGLTVDTPRMAMGPAGAERIKAWSHWPAVPPLTNIVGVLPGRDRTLPAVLLMAHHDSVWGSPGAADDGAGVAAILETVRAITAAGRPRRDLIVLLSDGEELGLEGAKAFFASDLRRGQVGVIVNLETRGGGGRASMFETGADNGAMMKLFRDAVHRPVTTSLSTFVYRLLPNSTDYTVAKRLGVPGFNFAFIGRPALYHSPLATPARLDQGAVQDMGRQVLDLTRALLSTPALPGKAPDRVFFDAFGLVLVSYPAALGWVLLALGAGGYAVAGWGAPVRSLAKGAGAMLALIALAVGLTWVVNLVSGADGPVNYYDRLAAIPRLQVQALLACLAVWAVMARGVLRGATVGAAIPLLVLAAVAQVAAPTAAYPLIVPLLLGGVALAVRRFAGDRAGSLAIGGAAMLSVGYMLGFAFFILQAVGPKMPMVAALPLAISALLLAPLVPAYRARTGRVAAGVLLGAALVVALSVRLDPIAPSVAVYSSDH